MAIVAHDYEHQNDDELDLKVGMVLQNIQPATDGWSKGTHEGKTGLFPNNFVSASANITPPPLASRSHPPTPPPPSPSPPPLPPKATKHGTAWTFSSLPSSPPPRDLPVEIARAAFEYVTDTDDELTVQVQLGEKTGLVPNEFVDLVSVPPKLDQATEKITAGIPGDLEPVEYPNPRLLERVRAVSAYTADHVDELTFQVGDVMEVLDRTEYGWYKVQLGDNTGLVPSSGFVEPLSSDHDLHTASTGKDEGPHLEIFDITDELAEWKQRCTELERSVQDLERRCRESEQALTTERDKASQTTATLEKRNTTLSDKLTATQLRVFQGERQTKVITRSCEQAETRAQRAEKEVLGMQIKAELAAKRLQESEQEIRQAYDRALKAEQRVVELTESSELAHRSLVEMTEKYEQGKEGLVELTRRCEQAEQRAAVAEITSKKSEEEKSFWVLSENEVELSDRELGRGGWAEVRTGMFRGTELAVKHLHTVIINRHNRDLFVREMNMASRVRHPNLVQFIGATMEGHPMILMELMPTSLRKVLEDAAEIDLRIPDKQLVAIAVDVAKALNYLHLTTPHPILHRDISSANVLMEPVPAGWKAKVSDYGSANFAHQLKTRAPGSPAYAAPESLNPRKQSPKMDVFSFGVLLIEMFTHKFPDPDHRDEMIRNVRHGRVVRMIESCLKDEPAHRPTMSTILQQLTSF